MINPETHALRAADMLRSRRKNLIGRIAALARDEKKSPSIFLIFILGAALIHGLTYVFVVPPWQHYDEPNHFEYAWLIAHRGRLPQPGDYDPQMRQEVAASMLAAGFFDNLDFRPDLNATDQPAWIGGYSQLGDPPAYYLLLAFPLWVFSGFDVTTQLYVARFVSLALYLVTIGTAWGLAQALTRLGSPLRHLLPLTIALVPGFADLMTAVNSDVGAVAVFSLFLWVSVCLVERGFAWLHLLALVAAAMLCVGVKSNVFVAVPLLLPVLLFTLLRGRWRALAWMLSAVGLLFAIATVFTWGEGAFWYRQINQASLARLKDERAVLGQHVFMAETSLAGISPMKASLFWQMLPPGVMRSLEGQVVTLGGWAWASQPVQISSPILHTSGGNLDFAQSWPLDVQPTFYAFTFTVPLGANHGWITLLPVADRSGVRVYWDGLVLAVGEHPPSPPAFDSPNGQTGQWGTPFENLLRGASAETGWPGVRPWADALSERLFPDRGRLSFVLHSLLDYPGTMWYYRSVAVNLLRTFWAQFGWGQVGLVFGRAYWWLAGVTFAGWLGALGFLAQRRRYLPWAALFCLGLSLVGIWGVTFVRGSIYLVYQRPFVPAARYAYPVMIPTMLVLVGGWLALARLLQRVRYIPVRWLYGVYGLSFLALDVFAIVSIVHFYA